ncbi:MAG: tetratricopeptide repeat protein [Chitinivibrionales bacterium]|nr:tetratricopeptide repeat protein [Chitinivibrionales bacterium]MBD3355981.1 tetratricopeptide repeat protein [Chitinivibrionales bacterium]
MKNGSRRISARRNDMSKFSFTRFRLTLVASAALIMGCAYLNTFYNAKVAFNRAYREQERFHRTSTDSSAQLPASVLAGYDRAIEKSKKVLDVYPKSEKWHDDALFLMARASYYKGDMPSAIRRLRKLQMSRGDSPFIPESYLYLGKAYMESDNLPRAEEIFHMIIERYPSLNKDEQVSLLLAELAIRREGKAQAITLLEGILETVTTIEKKIRIIIKISDLYMQLSQYPKALDMLVQAPRKKDFSGYLFHVDMNLLDCYIQLDRFEEALALVERMIRNKEYAGHDEEVLLKKAFIFDKMNKQDKAIALFEQLTESDGARWVRGRAYFELALIYQHKLGDYEKALEYYKQAEILSNDDEIKLTASKRAEAISWLQSHRDSLIVASEVNTEVDTSDTSSPEARPEPIAYRIGEIFWLKLEEPDSALHYFESVAHDTTSDTQTKRKAFYADAWISKHMKGDSARSDSLFELILTRYPATVHAKRAQKEMGFEITVMTREDSARQAFRDAENIYFEHGDALTAVNTYYRVAKAYPDQKDIASRSIYAAAWLCDNILYKEVTAKKLYSSLCDSFPESEYCRSEAYPRLRFVEDSLETLRRKRKKAPRRSTTKKREASTAAAPGSSLSDDAPEAAVDSLKSATASEAREGSRAHHPSEPKRSGIESENTVPR